jgi:hypothetical protein
MRGIFELAIGCTDLIAIYPDSLGMSRRFSSVALEVWSLNRGRLCCWSMQRGASALHQLEGIMRLQEKIAGKTIAAKR